MIIHYIIEENIFRTAGKLKCYIKDCFKINGKQTIKIPKKGEYNKFKNYEKNVDFESISVPKDNGKQKNPIES